MQYYWVTCPRCGWNNWFDPVEKARLDNGGLVACHHVTCPHQLLAPREENNMDTFTCECGAVGADVCHTSEQGRFVQGTALPQADRGTTTRATHRSPSQPHRHRTAERSVVA